MSDFADWLDPCWRYRLRRCASDTVSGLFHVSFGCCWAGIEILVDEFLTQVRAPVKENLSNSFEES